MAGGHEGRQLGVGHSQEQWHRGWWNVQLHGDVPLTASVAQADGPGVGLGDQRKRPIAIHGDRGYRPPRLTA